MINYFWCIIPRMLELCKRWGPYFFSAFIVLVTCIVSTLILLKNPIPIIVPLSFLAIICLIASITALYYDIKDACRKDKETKAAKVHKELVKAFKRMGLDDKRAEIAAKGRKE